MNRLLALFVLLLTVVALNYGQNEVTVRSWKWGEERVYPQEVKIEISKEKPEFEAEFYTISGKRYLLSVLKNYAVDLKDEHWKVVLNPIDLTAKSNKEPCRDLLIREYPCDTGGDSLSAQNDIAYIYPSYDYSPENMKRPRFKWIPHYPTATTRRILVDGFYVVVKVVNASFNEKDAKKIDRLEISIELANAPKRVNDEAKPKYLEVDDTFHR